MPRLFVKYEDSEIDEILQELNVGTIDEAIYILQGRFNELIKKCEKYPIGSTERKKCADVAWKIHANLSRLLEAKGEEQLSLLKAVWYGFKKLPEDIAKPLAIASKRTMKIITYLPYIALAVGGLYILPYILEAWESIFEAWGHRKK